MKGLDEGLVFRVSVLRALTFWVFCFLYVLLFYFVLVWLVGFVLFVFSFLLVCFASFKSLFKSLKHSVKYREWFGRSGGGPSILHFSFF